MCPCSIFDSSILVQCDRMEKIGRNSQKIKTLKLPKSTLYL